MVKTVRGKWLRVLYGFPFVYCAVSFFVWYVAHNTDVFGANSKESPIAWQTAIAPVLYYLLLFPVAQKFFGRNTAYTIGMALTFLPIALGISATGGTYDSWHEIGWLAIIASSALLGYIAPIIFIALGWMVFFINLVQGNLTNILDKAIYIVLAQSIAGFVAWAWLQRYYIQENQEAERFRRALQTERIQSEAVLGAIDSGIVICDKLGIVQHCNQSMATILGVKVDDVVGKSYVSVLRYVHVLATSHKIKSPVVVLRTFFTERKVQTIDYVSLRREDNTSVDITLHFTPLRSVDGDISSYMIVAHDISRLAHVQRMKDEFISVASHELRTPMTIIAGYADIMLKSKEAKKFSDKQVQQLTRIKASTVRLIELVNDMLDLSRLESHTDEAHLTQVHLAPFCTSIVQDLSEHYATKQLSLSAKITPVTVLIDEGKLRRVIINLLSNAYKFTPVGGKVELKSELSDGRVEISVIDNGEGITPEQQKRIFEKFSRLKGHENIEGTGLGLSICREIVNGWDGEISLESTVGRGTRFYFTIPSDMIQLVKRKKG